MKDKKNASEGTRARRGFRTRQRFTLLEFCVVLAVIGIMIGMAIPVWASIRENAYDAKAHQYHRYAEEAVEGYWYEVGQFEGGYGSDTAEYLEGMKPKREWIETSTSQIEGMDFADIPLEYFNSTLIVQDENAPLDELSIATVSQAGAVYYTHFKEADTVESLKLAFSDFRDREGRRLQADAKRESYPD